MRTIKELLTTLDVAIAAKADASTVRYWRNIGRLKPCAITSRGQALYRQSDVAKFIEHRRRQIVDEVVANADDAA